MPADVFTLIDGAPEEAAPTERQKRHELRDSIEAFEAALKQAGVIRKRGGQPEQPLDRICGRVEQAVWRYAQYFERRAQRAERLLRSMLASGALTAAQRGEIFQALFGATARDATTLSTIESELIAHYRRMDPAGRQMVLTLLRKLGAMSARDTQADGDPKGGAA